MFIYIRFVLVLAALALANCSKNSSVNSTPNNAVASDSGGAIGGFDTLTSVDCPLPPEQDDPSTTKVVGKRRYMLPEDGISNNNGSIGPFCCTGKTAVIKDLSAGAEVAYIYFYGWETQAYIVGDSSYVRETSVMVADNSNPSKDGVPALARDALRFTAQELASCVSHSVNVGAFTFIVRPRHSDVWRPSCLNGDLGYKMDTLSVAVDISLRQ